MRLLSVALHDQRSPRPSPVGVVFRGHHERAGLFVDDAVRAMDGSAGAEKRRPENEAAFHKKPTQQLSSAASKLTSDCRELTNQSPDPAHSHSGGVTGLACGMPASWRDDCCGMLGAGDEAAISVTVKQRD